MSQPLLFSDADVPPKRGKRAGKPGRLCPRCAAAVPPKPRTVMPAGHAVETVRGILIDRLDAALPDVERIVFEEAAEFVPEVRVRHRLAIRIIQAAQARLFPEEFGDGPAYTPDPAGRMAVPPHPERVGLVPRLPTVAIYARHLLAVGRQSPAAGLTMPDGEPVFTDADLCRLGKRIAGRSA